MGKHTTLRCILNIFCSFLCFWLNTLHQILLHCMSQCLLCLGSSPFSWLIDGACLPRLAVCGQGTLSASCIRYHTNVSLKRCCVNFDPQVVRMIRQLRMVRSRRWKNSFFVHFKVYLLKEYTSSSCGQICLHTPCVYYSPALMLVSWLFHTHHRNYPPMVENASSSVHLHSLCPYILWLSNYVSPESLTF